MSGKSHRHAAKEPPWQAVEITELTRDVAEWLRTSPTARQAMGQAMIGPKPAASVKQLILHEHELLANANDELGPYWELHAEITAEHFIRLARKLRAKGAEVAALRAANEKKAAALRSVLHRFRHASESQWYVDAQRALEESPP